MFVHPGVRALLISTHEAAVASHIGRKIALSRRSTRSAAIKARPVRSDFGADSIVRSRACLLSSEHAVEPQSACGTAAGTSASGQRSWSVLTSPPAEGLVPACFLESGKSSGSAA